MLAQLRLRPSYFLSHSPSLLPRVSSSLSLRTYSTPPPAKSTVPIALISSIRSSRPGTPLSLARSALLASNNDLAKALEWISTQAVVSGAIKAEKLSGREANEGLIGVVLYEGEGGEGEGEGEVRGAMIELSSETDFVARTKEFGQLVEGITRSLAFFAEPAPSSSTTTNINGGKRIRELKFEEIKEVPMLPRLSTTSSNSYDSSNEHSKVETIGSSIAGIVSRLGENISIRRAVSIAIPSSSSNGLLLAKTYLHMAKKGEVGSQFQSGSMASLLLFRAASSSKKINRDGLDLMTRALARQVVAVPTSSVISTSSVEEAKEGEMSTALYDQPLITISSNDKFQFEAGSNVKSVLEKWSKDHECQLEVLEVERWEVGGEKSQYR